MFVCVLCCVFEWNYNVRMVEGDQRWTKSSSFCCIIFFLLWHCFFFFFSRVLFWISLVFFCRANKMQCSLIPTFGGFVLLHYLTHTTLHASYFVTFTEDFTCAVFQVVQVIKALVCSLANLDFLQKKKNTQYTSVSKTCADKLVEYIEFWGQPFASWKRIFSIFEEWWFS